MEKHIMEKTYENLAEILGLIKYPLLTPKSFEVFKKNEYTFLVDRRLTKRELKLAFEKIFEVKILRINTLILAPKWRRVGKFLGKKSTYKKVIIKLRKEDFIPDIFN
jgi:large subunit ribosomal protein L23